ncbi:MAG: methionyl-tRNA formyltransferase [Isosphaeraceae bacterium]
MQPARLLMLGTGDFALPTFERLCDAGRNVVALITQPDRPQGRKQEIIPSPIRLAAERRGVPVHQPESINAPEGVALLRSLRPDLLITAAYGQILSAEVLEVPARGGINLHGSILPAYRGAAPVARAIERGESETGVTVIAMSPRVDAGGMIAFATTTIGLDETAGELEDRLALLGAPLVEAALDDVLEGRAAILPQDPGRVTKAPKLRKEDGRIDWGRPSRQIHNLVRAMQPWPGGFAEFLPPGRSEPIRLIVHQTAVAEGSGEPGTVVLASESANRLEIAAGSGAVALLKIQIPGKKPTTAAEFLRGYRLAPGDRLGPSQPLEGPAAP